MTADHYRSSNPNPNPNPNPNLTRTPTLTLFLTCALCVIIINIIIRFYGLSKQLAFIAQLVAVHEFMDLEC